MHEIRVSSESSAASSLICGIAEEPRTGEGIRQIAIVGAGVMGRGIAAANVRAGYRVRLFDAERTVAERAARAVMDEAESHARRRPHFLADRSPTPVTVAATMSELRSADLFIEAVPEDAALKSAVLSQLEPHLSPHAVIASNASSIPIATLAKTLKHPSRLCGLHFCHPVSERRLVEVVAAEATVPETLGIAVDYAASLGKNPIIVRDGPGFLLNRILSPYLNEALELLLEGAAPELLDRAALDFGMPWGPLRQLDEFGLDIALAVGGTLLRAFPDRFIPSELLIAMYKAGRLGRKSGGGFYPATDHEENHGTSLDPAVSELIRSRQRRTQLFTLEQIFRRLFLPMLLEAVRALEDAVVDDPAVVDTALRDGLGMTDCYRGLFGWANESGSLTILEWLQPLRRHSRSCVTER